jgi:putative intracellular protease/amidase
VNESVAVVFGNRVTGQKPGSAKETAAEVAGLL